MNTASSSQSFSSLITELIDGHCRPTDLENIELTIAWGPLDVAFNQHQGCEPPLNDYPAKQWRHPFPQVETSTENEQAELESRGFNLQVLKQLWLQLSQERKIRLKIQNIMLTTGQQKHNIYAFIHEQKEIIGNPYIT